MTWLAMTSTSIPLLPLPMIIDLPDPIPPCPLIYVAISLHFAFTPTITPLSQETPMDTMLDSASPFLDHLPFLPSHQLTGKLASKQPEHAYALSPLTSPSSSRHSHTSHSQLPDAPSPCPWKQPLNNHYSHKDPSQDNFPLDAMTKAYNK
jgi:hypothetical protein